MSNKASPFAIGAFVIGAVTLAIVGLLVFGSGKLFKRTIRVVCFFSGDVMGLNVGAPVKFKGVDVGSVADIRIRIPQENKEVRMEDIASGIRMPVFLDIDEDTLAAEGARQFDPERLKELIGLGLRAQLVSQSLVTGLLLVKLDFRPDTPATYALPPDSSLIEIPTVPTSLEEIQSAAQNVMKRLGAIDLQRLVSSGIGALGAVEDLAKSPGLREAMAALPATLQNANAMMTDLRGMIDRFNTQQGPLFTSFRAASDKATTALQEATEAMRSMRAMTAPDSPLSVDLAVTLRELAAAAHSVRLLADTLDRNPSALVRGTEVQAR